MTQKKKTEALDNTEIRRLVLQYFYDRNDAATSVRGKRGSAARISVVRADLKAQHGLSVQQVMSNLRYLISQGWVEQTEVKKDVPLRSGTVVPSATNFYAITAAGIDKIEGPSEFTRDSFHGVRIEATGQSIITVGDGNQVNATFRDAGEALSALADAVRSTASLQGEEKLGYIADIQSIQAQLAKPAPNRQVIQAVWSGMKGLATVNGVVNAFAFAARVIGQLHPK
jgi:hypothetical protein